MYAVYTDLDLKGNRLIAVVVDPVTADPTGAEGRLCYRSDLRAFRGYRNGAWVSLSTLNTIVTAPGSGLTGGTDNGTATLTIQVDGTSLQVNPTSGNLEVKDAGLTSAKYGAGSVNTAAIADGAVTPAKLANVASMRILGRTTTGTGTVELLSFLNENDLVSNSPTAVPTQASVKAYVDSRTSAGGLNWKGDYNPTTTSQYPADGSLGAMYRVSVDGNVLGTAVAIGDIIMAIVASPTPGSAAGWVIFEGNRGVPTETVAGITRIATQAEVTLGADDTTIVTPLKLRQRLDLLNAYTQIIGDGTTTVFTITHSKNLVFPTVLLYDNSADAFVVVETEVANTNQVILTFAYAPAAGAYTVIVKP